MTSIIHLVAVATKTSWEEFELYLNTQLVFEYKGAKVIVDAMDPFKPKSFTDTISALSGYLGTVTLREV